MDRGAIPYGRHGSGKRCTASVGAGGGPRRPGDESGRHCVVGRGGCSGGRPWAAGTDWSGHEVRDGESLSAYRPTSTKPKQHPGSKRIDFEVNLCYHILGYAPAHCRITSKSREPCYDYWSSLAQKHHFGISEVGRYQRGRLRGGWLVRQTITRTTPSGLVCATVRFPACPCRGPPTTKMKSTSRGQPLILHPGVWVPMPTERPSW